MFGCKDIQFQVVPEASCNFVHLQIGEFAISLYCQSFYGIGAIHVSKMHANEISGQLSMFKEEGHHQLLTQVQGQVSNPILGKGELFLISSS